MVFIRAFCTLDVPLPQVVGMWRGAPSTWCNRPLQLPRDSTCSIPFFPPPWAPQGDALEQGHHPESLCGLHPQVAEGATALQRPGEPAAIPGASQPQPAAPNSGLEGEGGGRGEGGFLEAEAEGEQARISPPGIFGGSPGFLTHMMMMMMISSNHNISKNNNEYWLTDTVFYLVPCTMTRALSPFTKLILTTIL